MLFRKRKKTEKVVEDLQAQINAHLDGMWEMIERFEERLDYIERDSETLRYVLKRYNLVPKEDEDVEGEGDE